MATKGIPYGVSDFQLLSSEDYYYVDKTRFIAEIEKSPRFLFLIRPRRFGKSLWLSMLELYYDMAMKDKFEELFGHWQPPDGGAEQLPDFEVQLCDGKPGTGGAGAVL